MPQNLSFFDRWLERNPLGIAVPEGYEALVAANPIADTTSKQTQSDDIHENQITPSPSYRALRDRGFKPRGYDLITSALEMRWLTLQITLQTRLRVLHRPTILAAASRHPIGRPLHLLVKLV